jgi:23S rRNA (adenine2503-C2)-methyltransferase
LYRARRGASGSADLGRSSLVHYNGNKIKSTATLGFEVGMSHRGVKDRDTASGLGSISPRAEELVPVPAPPNGKRPILSAPVHELGTWIVREGHPAYRARQVLNWLIHRRVESFEPMSDLPKSLRRQLDAEWEVFTTRTAHRGVTHDGTQKLVLECSDRRQIECVLMSEGLRRTVCLSTQVGCGMGCVFCASGLGGVERNLNTHEILEQAFRLRNLLPLHETVSHIVVMGMGESLANLDNLIAALDRLCSADEGLGISQRRVTISTVGLPAKILKLAALNRRYHLAISLHAPTEALRNYLVPVSETLGLGAVLAAADAYFEQTGRQVTYEYVLLSDVNDRPADALALAKLLASRQAHVNLIPYNPVAGLPYDRSSPEAVREFAAVLRDNAVSVTVRKTKGREIDAACGQLRHRLEQYQALDQTPHGLAELPGSGLPLANSLSDGDR